MPVSFSFIGKGGEVEEKSKTDRKMRNLYNRAKRQGYLESRRANKLIKFLYGYNPGFKDSTQSGAKIIQLDELPIRYCKTKDCENEISFRRPNNAYCPDCKIPVSL